MSKKKAKICTMLLCIIIIALWVSSAFIKLDEEISLYDMFCVSIFPIISVCKINEWIGCFYEWLTKTE